MPESLFDALLPRLLAETPSLVITLCAIGWLWRSQHAHNKRQDIHIDRIRTLTERELRPNHGQSLHDRVLLIEDRLRSLREMLDKTK